MHFPKRFALGLADHAKRFTVGNVTGLPHAQSGVYVFLYGETFIYVGKSSKALGVKQRLLSHYNGTHNRKLDTWLRALDGEVRFAYVTCQEDDLDDLEKSMIIFLQPRANEILYKSYVPAHKQWSKSYG